MSVEKILTAIDQERRKITNFRCAFLWYSEQPVIAGKSEPLSVGNDWMLGEVITKEGMLFSDVHIHDDKQDTVIAATGWLGSHAYSTLRQPDQPLTRLQRLSKPLSSLHHIAFESMQIDPPRQAQWSQLLERTEITFVGEETFHDLSCLCLEWKHGVDIGLCHGHWLVCPERDHKIVYSETYTPGTAHGFDAEMIEVKSIHRFHLIAENWMPTLTTFVQGTLFSDGRRELNQSQRITEIFDLEIGTVDDGEPLLTPPLKPGVELILEGGKRQWTALKQRLAVGAK